MIGVIWDLFQTLAIILLAILYFAERSRGIEVPTGQVQYIMPSSQAFDDDPKPICGCTHHQCFHDENGCGHTFRSGRQYSSDPRLIPPEEITVVKCGCKGYIGPEALPTVLP